MDGVKQVINNIVGSEPMDDLDFPTVHTGSDNFIVDITDWYNKYKDAYNIVAQAGSVLATWMPAAENTKSGSDYVTADITYLFTMTGYTLGSSSSTHITSNSTSIARMTGLKYLDSSDGTWKDCTYTTSSPPSIVEESTQYLIPALNEGQHLGVVIGQLDYRADVLYWYTYSNPYTLITGESTLFLTPVEEPDELEDI